MSRDGATVRLEAARRQPVVGGHPRKLLDLCCYLLRARIWKTEQQSGGKKIGGRRKEFR
ncbi:uncharacterized protein J3R85_002475 [Psidium guajava]|nr:uncharacterized protein J3R85_002475 [Psidium guajava]